MYCMRERALVQEMRAVNAGLLAANAQSHKREAAASPVRDVVRRSGAGAAKSAKLARSQPPTAATAQLSTLSEDDDSMDALDAEGVDRDGVSLFTITLCMTAAHYHTVCLCICCSAQYAPTTECCRFIAYTMCVLMLCVRPAG
jgi:hypothetical protein